MEISLTILIALFTLITPVRGQADSECEKWFTSNKFKIESENCVMGCATLPVDMGTFSCPGQCDTLCKSLSKKGASEFTYPRGMTKGDRRMVVKYPAEAIKVYEAKQIADDLTNKVFKKPGRNDESDAFRHFVWSALITKELGVEKALEFLNAHEEEDGQPKNEKEMDDANNRSGSEFILNKTKKGMTSELDEIEREALERLKKGNLKVISPSKKKIPDGYYSN